ncbi:MAG: hypothetical protein M3483_01560 [Gemmatimonadota bacterium]|nr:hypothetical protein [Gemmatimonadota bacterium]
MTLSQPDPYPDDPADGLAGADPLLRALRIQERVSRLGFDWADPRGGWEKVREEIEEVGAELGEMDRNRLEEEIGDLLFSVVNLARLLEVHPGRALARANARFSARFTEVERLAAERGMVVGEASLEELDALWNEIKHAERG